MKLQRHELLTHNSNQTSLLFLLHHFNGVERCYPSRRYVRMSVTKCTIIYSKQMAVPRKQQFLYMYAHWQGTFASPFSSKSSTSLIFISKWKIRIEYIWKFICDYLANGDRLDKHFYCHHIGRHVWPFHCHIYTWPWPIIKVKVVKVMHI